MHCTHAFGTDYHEGSPVLVNQTSVAKCDPAEELYGWSGYEWYGGTTWNRVGKFYKSH